MSSLNPKLNPYFLASKKIAAILIILVFSSSALLGQNDLIEAIMDLSKTKKGLEFNPSELPQTANPYLSILPPGTKCDYRGWQNYYLRQEQHARLTGAKLPARITGLQLPENERQPGQNDTQRRGNRIRNFGTSPGQNNRVVVNGISGSEDVDISYFPATAMEDDGSIPLSNISEIQEAFIGESYEGLIGDGPVAGLSDFDFYKVQGSAGQTISVDVVTPEPFLDLDPFVGLFDAAGVLLAFNDDGSSASFDSSLKFELPADGSYYICVGGWGAFIPADPFDSQSGSVTGDLGSEGEYDLFLTYIEISTDVDFYVFPLKKGDVFGAGIDSKLQGTILTVYHPNQLLAAETALNTSFYPIQSPISLDGTSSTYHIAESDGNYAISVAENFGAYTLELVVARPGLETKAETQVIFLDFDGAIFDLNKFLGIPGSDKRRLSPFRSFLGAWGLSDSPQNVARLIDKTTRIVQENLDQDLRRSGANPNFDVVVVNNTNRGSIKSTPGFPVSQVIVGGTIEESGIATIGIAESIDPGNFANEELALVLLDVLSSPGVGDPLLSFSLNDVALAPGTKKEDLVAIGVGNIISHEIGHYIGNWHCDGFDNIQTLMDEGPGGIFNLIGVGSTGVFGDNQTIDVDFITDYYSTLELFAGVENTLNQSAFGLSSGSSQEVEAFFARFNLTEGLQLSQTYPNPSAPTNRLPITFKVDQALPVQLQVQGLDGKRVALLYDGVVEADEEYNLNFFPSSFKLKPGIYVYRLMTPKGTVTRKMFITK